MQKSNIYTSGNGRKINKNWFTNHVHMKEISSTIKSREQNIYHVYFEKGARTKLHMHNGNQILIATRGSGSLELFKRLGKHSSRFMIRKTKAIKLNEGDIVYIPKNTLHTHGSVNPSQTFSHIAINILPRKNSEYKTIWYNSDFKNTVTGIVT
jgi:quercetin dioxygenase-like cupin family protein